MLSETFGAVEDTAKMVRNASKAGVVYTAAWEKNAKKEVQLDQVKRAVKMRKQVDKLMQDIDPDMLVLGKDGYYDLDLGKLIEAYK